MGNKNARAAKKTSLTVSSISSITNSGIGQKSTSTTQVVEVAKVPSHLAFKSYAAGTLDTRAFQPADYVPKPVKVVSSVTITEQGVPAAEPISSPRAQRAAIRKQKIPAATTSTRKTTHLPQKPAKMESTKQKLVVSADSELPVLDTEKDAQKFWQEHQVVLIIDLASLSSAANIQILLQQLSKADSKGKGQEITAPLTILDKVIQLGDSFRQYATDIVVELRFPQPTPSVRPINLHTIGPNSGIAYTQATHMASFKLVQQLAAVLNTCASLSSLAINLRNPDSQNIRRVLTMEQLLHALPFYDLDFEAWTLHYQTKEMVGKILVGKYAERLLNKSRRKWLADQEAVLKKAAKEERKEAERINNLVFVHKSAQA